MDLRPDLVQSSRLSRFVVLIDGIGGDIDHVQRLAEGLEGTDGLIITTAREVPLDVAGVELDRLSDDECRTLCDAVAPSLSPYLRARVLGVAAGRPGVVVPVARANRRQASPDAPLTIVPDLRKDAQVPLRRLTPALLDIARWVSLMGDPFEPALLARMTDRTTDRAEAILDELAELEVVEQVPEPGTLRYRFTDPLVAEITRQMMPPADARTRNAALLVARRAVGDGPQELVPFAVGAVDADQVIALSLRAAADARESDDSATALVHAERALAWCDVTRPASDRLSAELERGLAMARLGQWAEASTALRDVAAAQRRAGNDGASLRAATEWARVRWFAAEHDEALAIIANAVPQEGAPSADRADALQNAAMLALMSGKHTTAEEWARRSMSESTACDYAIGVIAALNALGLSKVCATGDPTHLSYVKEASKTAIASHTWRQAAVSLNNEAMLLSALGLARLAVDRADDGLMIVDQHHVAELEAPLTHNRAEALASMGRLRECRLSARRSRDAYASLGTTSVSYLDAIDAWIDFAQGKVPEALEAMRRINAESRTEDLTIQDVGPQLSAYIHVACAAGEIAEAQDIARDGLGLWGQTEDRLEGLGLLAAACTVLPLDETSHERDELAAIAGAGAPFSRAALPLIEAFHATGSEAADAFRRAADLFGECESWWWSARARMLAGEAAGANGADDLQEARRLFREFEAPQWRSKCEAALRAIGHLFVMASPNATHELGITAREVEVIHLIQEGLLTRDMANRLFISDRTVERHVAHLLEKLGVTTRSGIVRAAIERGLITADDQTPSSTPA